MLMVLVFNIGWKFNIFFMGVYVINIIGVEGCIIWFIVNSVRVGGVIV